jgi:hypothetical protein
MLSRCIASLRGCIVFFIAFGSRSRPLYIT